LQVFDTAVGPHLANRELENVGRQLAGLERVLVFLLDLYLFIAHGRQKQKTLMIAQNQRRNEVEGLC
jgi:hypothetical protein